MKSVGGAIAAIIAVLIVAAVIWFTVPHDNRLRESPPQVDPLHASDAMTVPEDAQQATVNYVHDGDTLFLTTPDDPNLKVRLLGIDTPEVGDCYADVATRRLTELAPEGSTVHTSADVEPFDKYGRSLLYLWTEDGKLINLALVEEGLAESVFIGENREREGWFEESEDAAKLHSLGIWGAC